MPGNWGVSLGAGLEKAGESIGEGLLQRGKNKISIMDILSRDQIRKLQQVQEEMDAQGSEAVRKTLGENPAAGGEELGRAYIAGGGMANKGSTIANQLSLASSRDLQSKEALNSFVAQKAQVRGIKGIDAPSAVDTLIARGFDPADPQAGQAVLEGMLNFSTSKGKITLMDSIMAAAERNAIRKLPTTGFWNPTVVKPPAKTINQLKAGETAMKKEMYPAFYRDDEQGSSVSDSIPTPPQPPISAPAATKTYQEGQVVRDKTTGKLYKVQRGQLVEQ